MGKAAQENFFALFDGQSLGPDAVDFVDVLRGVIEKEIGYPAFLRTGHTSGKHEWEDTCFIADYETDLVHHVIGIIEYSEMAGIIGMPWDWWAVREFLTGVQAGVCPNYGNMPVCREWRVFVKDVNVVCFHPYWPDDALEQGGMKPGQIEAANEALHDTSNIEDALRLAANAGDALGGAWSVDVFDTATKGWFITDLAEAHKSYHDEECPHFDELRTTG